MISAACRPASARNILLVQGAGGNSSVKQDDVLWVKASGAWLSEAKEKEMFVPVELAARAPRWRRATKRCRSPAASGK